MSSSKYVPAAGHDWLLPLYDPSIRLLMPERKVRGQLIEWANIGVNERVLDLGCGTGTLAVMAKSAHPEAEIVGLDGDPRALAMARRKAKRAGVEVKLDQGLVSALPSLLLEAGFTGVEELDQRSIRISRIWTHLALT